MKGFEATFRIVYMECIGEFGGSSLREETAVVQVDGDESIHECFHYHNKEIDSGE